MKVGKDIAGPENAAMRRQGREAALEMERMFRETKTKLAGPNVSGGYMYRASSPTDHWVLILRRNALNASMEDGTNLYGIAKVVCQEMDVTKEDFKSARRSVNMARARQIFMYLARHKTSHSLPEIGRYVNRDHTTVIHGVDRIKDLLAKDERLAKIVRRINRRLRCGK